MAALDRVSTGSSVVDEVIDGLRLGDNVVWQVDSIDDYGRMVDPFVAQARADGRRLVYVRFGNHRPLVAPDAHTVICQVDPRHGFETFATEVHALAEREGLGACYVFDSLTELLPYWHSDLTAGDFLEVTCPFLHELGTIAYFAIVRGAHTYATIAGIRETTQLLLDLHRVDDRIYLHPLKVWQRYSPTMFLPSLVEGDEAVSVTASAEVLQLLSRVEGQSDRLDHWNVTLARAREALTLPAADQEATKTALMRMVIGGSVRMFELGAEYFSLADLLAIASRKVGSGLIGGKSVGMLLARKILERDGGERFTSAIEAHDSYFIGSDVFYTYIVQNGWWPLRARQRTGDGYYSLAPELRDKLLRGRFPDDLRKHFTEMLEHFGHSPIIVRSSSVLEDDFGNAFAGKYESVLCANQGSPEERFRAFEEALRVVYASTMSEEVLDYRMNRGLVDRDEQMAILVQRVSGDQHDGDYFPHVAGVGNSSNLYVWDPSVDMAAGMLRLVFGLGTRAVGRTVGDYARIVCLDDPMRLPPTAYGEAKKYSQRGVDVLSLSQNAWRSRAFEEVIHGDLKADASLFISVDEHPATRQRERGSRTATTSCILDFRGLLTRTEFPSLMRDALTLLAGAYGHPVDVEFTANLKPDGDLRVNILQCRPLQTRGVGAPVPVPRLDDVSGCVFCGTGNFMGGNVRIPLDHIVYVRPTQYLALPEQDRHAVARHIGKLNAALKGTSTMLIGPGRWGTTTPALGVPLRFAELCNMAVIGEVASPGSGFSPELSYGSHFFQDLVESGIFYVAIVPPESRFNESRIIDLPNVIATVSPKSAHLGDVIHVADASGIEVCSDISTQVVLCR